ncbi:hypothetical protein Poly51_55870 [Rubripirellula tenax]|uniref:Uncharacterized protein n=1 Tax=Rubripirellula tenax TaxID=2528015 RepID=A0A5C6EB49_9BACT|nr:hypothetical protein Poly51_55870 [Rubripirellula tenax]
MTRELRQENLESPRQRREQQHSSATDTAQKDGALEVKIALNSALPMIASPIRTGDNKSMTNAVAKPRQEIISPAAPQATEGSSRDNKSKHGISTHCNG